MEGEKKEVFEEEIVDEKDTNQEVGVDADEEVKDQEGQAEKDEVESQQVGEDDNTVKLKETIARLQADFQNYRNRTEKEKTSIYSYANESLIKKLLPVIDNLERAMATEKEHDAFYEGVEMIYNELIKVLEDEGLERFDPTNEKFDPNFHHAVFMEESETVESEHIIETFQIGYKIKDKVIRPAMVKVAK